MENKIKARRSHEGWMLLGLFGILVLGSTLLVAARLHFVTEQHTGTQIDLLETPLTQAAYAQVGKVVEEGYDPSGTAAGEPDFQVSDDTGLWSSGVKVEIFRIHYTGEGEEITVAGEEGDYVLAPGTGNQYAFTLSNPGGVDLSYTLTAAGAFENEAYTIPVEVKLYDQAGNYCAGGADSWAEIADLSQVAEEGSLSAGGSTTYILEWQWPYEGDDEADTLLGNLATEEDIALTIQLSTLAEADYEDVAEADLTPTPSVTEPAETMPAETMPAETTPAETIPAESKPAESAPAETTPDRESGTAAQPSGQPSSGSGAQSQGTSPKTGDDSHLMVWLILGVVSLGLMVLLLLLLRKSGEEAHHDRNKG